MLRLDPGLTLIRIKGLFLRTYIGIKDEGINNKQNVSINLTILYTAVDAAQGEDRIDSPNYDTITKALFQQVEGCHFVLLEHLPQVILDLVMEHPAVCCAEVEVNDVHGPQPYKSASITLTKFRDPPEKLL
jgi:D-erythro-7,8-dihydroneopterin triphosphate epimerase